MPDVPTFTGMLAYAWLGLLRLPHSIVGSCYRYRYRSCMLVL